MSLTIDLCGRNLINMDFSVDASAKRRDGEPKWQGAQLVGTDLRGANFTRCDLNHACLRGSDLRGAVFQEANLYGVDFRGADLRGAFLKEANLEEARFYGADLKGADLRATVVTDRTIFIGADLRGIIINDRELSFVIGTENFKGAIRDF